MAIDDKPCTMCAFWSTEKSCSQTWRLVFHIKPNGGIVEFDTTPGMVPEHIKQKLIDYFDSFITRMLPVIEAIPLWDDIREWQLAHPDRGPCPGRVVRKDVPYLHVVPVEKVQMDLGGRKV